LERPMMLITEESSGLEFDFSSKNPKISVL
jgi:hypothetical protein